MCQPLAACKQCHLERNHPVRAASVECARARHNAREQDETVRRCSLQQQLPGSTALAYMRATSKTNARIKQLR